MKIFVHVNGGDQDFYMTRLDIPDIGDHFVENGGILYEAGNYFLDRNGDFFKDCLTIPIQQRHCIYAKIIKMPKELPPVAKPATGFEIEPMMISDVVEQLNYFLDSYGDVEIDGIKQEKSSHNHNFMFRVSMNYDATSINISKPTKKGI